MNPNPTSRLRLSVPVAALRWSVPGPSRVESVSFRHTLAGSAFQFHFIIIISDVAELRLTSLSRTRPGGRYRRAELARTTVILDLELRFQHETGQHDDSRIDTWDYYICERQTVNTAKSCEWHIYEERSDLPDEVDGQMIWTEASRLRCGVLEMNQLDRNWKKIIL